jgi:tripartite-type tricarboxylate transporter receptor subunit TctC
MIKVLRLILYDLEEVLMLQVLRALALAALATCWLPAQAQSSQALRIVVPWPSGGVDLLPRAMAPVMAEALGRPVIVENRPGAGGTIGIAAVAKSDADGNTVVMTDMTSYAISVALYRKLPFDPHHDLVPVGLVARSPLALAVNPSLGVKTFPEFVALVKSRPGKLNYASSGNGAITHLAMERLKRMAGLDLVHVPYKGSAPAIAAVLSGETAAAFSTVPAVLSNARAGKLTLLGVTLAKPLPQLPEVAPISRQVPGYEIGLYQGVLAPAGTPKEAIERIHAAMLKALDDEKVRTVMSRGGFEAIPSTPAELQAHLDGEFRAWGELVQALGLKID